MKIAVFVFGLGYVGLSMAVLFARRNHWLGRILARKPKTLVAIALANKMARQIWAMVTRNADFKDPVSAVVI